MTPFASGKLGGNSLSFLKPECQTKVRWDLRRIRLIGTFREFHLIAFAVLGLLAPISVAVADDGVFAETTRVAREQGNTGLAAVLMQNGIVRSEEYLGLAIVEESVPVSAQTRFQVMSVTKAFVGAALIKSASAGVVDLDVPIQAYLPDYPRPESGEITLRNLAAHTAGIPHLGHPGRRAVYVEHYSDASSALAEFRELPLLHNPGEAYEYSSSGYNLIAAVLEAAHGKPFQEVLRELVLTPLELDDTAVGDVLRPTRNLARSYSFVDIWTYQPLEVLQQVPTWDFSYNPGGGNLITTARDLAKFGDAFTAPGFFTEAELALIFARISPELSPWSFGWFVNEDGDGNATINISGATPGVQAALIVDPRNRISMAVLSNCWGKGSGGGDLVVGAPRRDLEAWLRARQ
ncbi:MAG: serine hydrolase domain-containing protein [Blastomonas sp.]